MFRGTNRDVCNLIRCFKEVIKLIPVLFTEAVRVHSSDIRNLIECMIKENREKPVDPRNYIFEQNLTPTAVAP